MKYGLRWLAAALAVSMLFTVAGCKPKDEPVNNPSQPSSQEEVTHPIDPAIQKDVDLLIARYILPYETTLRGQAFSNVSQTPTGCFTGTPWGLWTASLFRRISC